MNLCGACGQDFTSVSLFDKHRVGKHEHPFSQDHPDGRRCLDLAEMAGLGWERNPRGRWFDPSEVSRGVRALHRSPQRASEIAA